MEIKKIIKRILKVKEPIVAEVDTPEIADKIIAHIQKDIAETAELVPSVQAIIPSRNCDGFMVKDGEIVPNPTLAERGVVV